MGVKPHSNTNISLPPKYSFNSGSIQLFGIVAIISIPVLVGKVGLEVIDYHASIFYLIALVHALYLRHKRTRRYPLVRLFTHTFL